MRNIFKEAILFNMTTSQYLGKASVDLLQYYVMIKRLCCIQEQLIVQLKLGTKIAIICRIPSTCFMLVCVCVCVCLRMPTGVCVCVCMCAESYLTYDIYNECHLKGAPLSSQC